MAKFRLASVDFDEDEQVFSVTAVVDDDTFQFIAGLVRDLEGSKGVWSPEVMITLPVGDAMRLRGICGGMNDLTPDHKISGAIYQSLGVVYFGLIEG